jgi:hypothetical protein
VRYRYSHVPRADIDRVLIHKGRITYTVRVKKAMHEPYGPRYKRVIPRHFLMVAGLVLVIGTLIGSFLPGSAKGRIGTHPYEPRNGQVHREHRWYHFATFGSIALIYLLLAKGIRQEVRAALSVFALGCSIEGTQRWTGFSEVMEWWDVRDDLYAVLSAFILVQVANSRKMSELASRLGTPRA